MPAGRPREFDYDHALEQAILVFKSKGYEGASMPDLTEAMGMNRPSIYASFGNKEELFRKALERYMQKAEEKAHQDLDVPDIKDALANFFRTAMAGFTCKESPKGCLAVGAALVVSDDSAGAREEGIRQREQIFLLLKERLDRAVTDGQLAPKADTRALARFYTAVLQGMSVQSVTGTCAEGLQGIVDTALAALPA
jgi:AcrR family transcriptional regulator